MNPRPSDRIISGEIVEDPICLFGQFVSVVDRIVDDRFVDDRFVDDRFVASSVYHNMGNISYYHDISI